MKMKVYLTLVKTDWAIINVPEEIAKIYAIPDNEQTTEQWWAIQHFQEDGIYNLAKKEIDTKGCYVEGIRWDILEEE